MTSSIRMSIALLILAQILDPSNANLVQSNGAGKDRIDEFEFFERQLGGSYSKKSKKSGKGKGHYHRSLSGQEVNEFEFFERELSGSNYSKKSKKIWKRKRSHSSLTTNR